MFSLEFSACLIHFHSFYFVSVILIESALIISNTGFVVLTMISMAVHRDVPQYIAIPWLIT